jgi:hypothetical protein
MKTPPGKVASVKLTTRSRGLVMQNRGLRESLYYVLILSGVLPAEQLFCVASAAFKGSAVNRNQSSTSVLDVSSSPNAVALSASELARQFAAFRTTRTGVPGVVRVNSSGSFRALYVAADGEPTRIGLFDTIDQAVGAIKSAYAAMVEAE